MSSGFDSIAGGSTSGGSSGGGSGFDSLGGGTATKAKTSGGGGFLGGVGSFLSDIPGEHLVSAGYHGALNAGTNFGVGLFNAGRASFDDIRHHPLALTAGPLAPFAATGISFAEGGHGGQLYNKVEKPIALSYKNKYGAVFEHPLEAKSWDTVGHNIEKDPFGTFLDALTLATLPFTAGDSAAIRGATLAMDAGRIAKLDDIARLPEAERAAALSDAGETSLRARRYVSAMSHKLPVSREAPLIEGEAPHTYQIRPARTPWGRYLQSKALDVRDSPALVNTRIGGGPKLLRSMNVKIARQSQVYLQHEKQAQAILAPLTPDEKVAVVAAREGVRPQTYVDNVLKPEYERDPTQHLAHVIDRLQEPGVAAALENPSKQFLKADKALADLSNESTSRLEQIGEVNPLNAAMRRILPQRMAGGARFDDQLGEFTGGPNAEELLHQTENPIHPALQPVSRVPHVAPSSVEKQAGAHTGMSVQKAVSETKKLGVTRQSHGARFLSGERSFDPQTVLDDFLQTGRYQHKLAIRDNLINEIARPLNHGLGGGKHPDEYYIRTKPNQQIPHGFRDQDAMVAEMGKPGEKATRSFQDTLDHEARNEVFKENELPADLKPFRDNPAKLSEMGIRRLPPSFGRSYRDTFGGGRSLRSLDRALSMWRVLELAKPGYAVHNIVQQHALFATRFGLRGFRDMARLVRDPELRQALEERTPGVAQSGQYGQLGRVTHQGIYADDVSRVAKAAQVPAGVVKRGLGAYWKAIHHLNIKYAEDLPRQAGILRSLEHLRQANESLVELVKRADPQDIEMATDESLRFLGDFAAMSDVEKKVMNRIFPLLWPWFRTITAVSTHLIKDYPGRILLLQKLAQVAPKEQQPSWLKGALILGKHGGIETQIEQSQLNPFGTFGQTSDEPLASQMNPFLQAIATGATGNDPFTGKAYAGIGAAPGQSLSADTSRTLGYFLGGLPEETTGSQILGGVKVPGTNYAPIHTAKPSKEYTNQQLDALYAWLGLPIKHVKRSQAKKYAKEGL